MAGRLKKVIDQIKPDIIHAGPIQTCALMTALTGFKNLVSVSWGYDLLRDVNNGRMWRWATKFTLKRSASFIADCETVRRAAMTYGMDPERMVIFPWGVDLDRFRPNPSIKKGVDLPFTLLSTRSWEPVYGIEVIAKAFVENAQKHPNLRMIMTGNGSLAGELRRILQRGGVLDRVTLPGHVSQDAMPKFLQSADLYISASHVDGASISLLEAIACGCPVVVSDIPGNLEWIEDGVQGWIFPDGSSKQLVNAIDRAIEKRDHLKLMGEKGRALAETRANWTLNYPKLKVAYEMAVCHGQ
jgi:glycosyltransferase involved in cell wall biosynthesis